MEPRAAHIPRHRPNDASWIAKRTGHRFGRGVSNAGRPHAAFVSLSWWWLPARWLGWSSTRISLDSLRVDAQAGHFCLGACCFHSRQVRA